MLRRRRPPNPFQQLKQRQGLTYPKLAELLGCSVATAAHLGCENDFAVSPTTAVEYERRSKGAVDADAIMRWAVDRLRHGALRDAA